MSDWIVPHEDMGCDGAYLGYEELIRCKECGNTETDGLGAIYCKQWDRLEMPEDGFCAWAKHQTK